MYRLAMVGCFFVMDRMGVGVAATDAAADVDGAGVTDDDDAMAVAGAAPLAGEGTSFSSMSVPSSSSVSLPT